MPGGRAMETSPLFRPDREGDRILAALVDASHDAIIGKDLAGLVLTWNGAAERMYGYTRDEMVGAPIARLVPPDRLDELGDIMRRIAVGERVAPLDTVRVAKNGRRIDVSITVSPIRDSAGRVVGASTLARDVTSERQTERALRNSEARWRAIVETAVDGIILIDRRGRVEFFNPSAERLFGLRAADVLGKNVSSLMPEPHASAHDEYLSRYARTGERRIIGIGREVDCLRQDGATFPAQLSVAEITIDGEAKFVGVIRDRTEHVKLEARLREESGLARLGELAAILAHEVRNPLAAVSGAIQMLSEHLPSDEDRGIVDEILRRLEGLGGLMNDLLTYARPPRPKVVRVNLAELIASLVAFFRADPGWTGVEVVVSGRVGEVAADPELLKLAIQNLLLNSVQAMQGRGRLVVGATEGDGTVSVDIVDSGPGMSAATREKLFTPFFTTKSRGTGLGLAIVRRIAEAHGGGVRIVESSERGTTVRLSLPSVSESQSSWSDY